MATPLDFAFSKVYPGKSKHRDSVMSLSAHLGTSFHLYMDIFYISPNISLDLFSLNIRALSTFRDSRREFTRTHSDDEVDL